VENPGETDKINLEIVEAGIYGVSIWYFEKTNGTYSLLVEDRK